MNEREIFETAVEIPDPKRRAIFLDRACGGDEALRRRVDALLASHDQAGGFLENSPVAGGNDPTMRLVGAITSADSAPLPHPSVPNDAEDESSDPDETRSGDLRILLPSDKPGSIGRLGHYEVIEILGRGAFGIVFKAFDERLHRLVAIKALSPELAATSPPRKRFLREARSVAAVKHDNIVQIYSVDDSPTPYLAMEFVDGRTLQQELAGEGPLDVPDILRLGQQMAAGLAAAHDKGLIHRDIKPGNILIEAGIDRRVKITDFGLARAADDATMTRTGMIAGTPMYMAPEQALGRSIDHRADLFSLGSVLYQMACGRPPFRGANAIAVLKRVVDEDPRPIRDILPDVPEWLCAIIDKLQAKSPDDRFASAKEVADLLGRCRNELEVNGKVTCVTWRPRSAPEPAKGQRPSQSASANASTGSRRGALIAGALLLVGAIGLGITEATGITSLLSRRAEVADERRPDESDGTPESSRGDQPDSPDIGDSTATDAGTSSDTSAPRSAPAGSLMAALDPSRIPGTERFDWQPKELVAVIGSHVRRMWNPCVAAAISADGARVAATDSRRIDVWDFASGELLHEIVSERTVSRIAFGADSDRLLAFVDGMPAIRTYDLSRDPPSVSDDDLFSGAVAERGGWLLESGRVLLTSRFDQRYVLELHATDAGSSDEPTGTTSLDSTPYPHPDPYVLIASDIDRIVYRSQEQRLRTADIVGGRFANDRELAIPTSESWGLIGLTSDGSKLVLRNDGRFQLWNIAEEPVLMIDRIGESEGLSSESGGFLSPDGRHLVLKYNQSALFRLNDRAATFIDWIERTDGSGQFGSAAAFSSDSQRLVICGANGLVRWWKLDGAIPVEPAPFDKATALSQRYDDRTIDWDAARGRLLLPLAAPPDQGGAQYRLWDLDGPVPEDLGSIVTPNWAPLLKAAGSRFIELSYNPGFPVRLRGDETTDFEVASTEIGEYVMGNTSPDGRRLVLVAPAGSPERLEGWNLDREVPEHDWTIVPDDPMPKDGGGVWMVWFSGDGGRFATLAIGDEPGTSKLVIRESRSNPPAVLATVPFRTPIWWYRAALSADGKLLAHTPDQADEIVLVDLSGSSPKELKRVRDDRLVAQAFAYLAFRPDGRRLAIGSQIGVTIVDVPSLRPVWAMRSPGAVEWLDWSADGRHLVTYNANRTAYVLRLDEID